MDKRIEVKIPPRRRGLWGALGYLFSGPVAALGAKEITKGGRTIRALIGAIKEGPQRDPRILTEEEGRLDLKAIAFRFGTTEAGVEEMLRNRRRQTARATFCYLAGGASFLCLWFYVAFLTPSYASVTYVIGLLTVCAVFLLSAFHNALVNWQARTRRLGTAREFLNARETWWPS